MGSTTEYSASQAVETLKLMASAEPELLETADRLSQATKSVLLAQAAGSTQPDASKTLALSLNQFGAGRIRLIPTLTFWPPARSMAHQKLPILPPR